MTTIEQLIAKHDITMTIDHHQARVPHEEQSAWQRGASGFTLTLHREGKQSYTFDFWQGSAIGTNPSAADCIYCLAMDAQSGALGYHDFRSDFGLDDTEETRNIYQACVETNKALAEFFGEEYIDFVYAEHDD